MLSSETMKQGQALAAEAGAISDRFRLLPDADLDRMPLSDLFMLGASFGGMSLGLEAVRLGLIAILPATHIRENIASASVILDRLEGRAAGDGEDEP